MDLIQHGSMLVQQLEVGESPRTMLISEEDGSIIQCKTDTLIFINSFGLMLKSQWVFVKEVLLSMLFDNNLESQMNSSANT